MTTKRNLSLAMGLLLASTAFHAQEVVNRGIDMSVVTGGVSVPTGTATRVQRNVKFGDRSYQIPENFEIGSYYATWGIYGGRDYWPADVPVAIANMWSHIMESVGSTNIIRLETNPAPPPLGREITRSRRAMSGVQTMPMPNPIWLCPTPMQAGSFGSTPHIASAIPQL
jgi:hypothetical protein